MHARFRVNYVNASNLAFNTLCLSFLCFEMKPYSSSEINEKSDRQALAKNLYSGTKFSTEIIYSTRLLANKCRVLAQIVPFMDRTLFALKVWNRFNCVVAIHDKWFCFVSYFSTFLVQLKCELGKLFSWGGFARFAAPVYDLVHFSWAGPLK